MSAHGEVNRRRLVLERTEELMKCLTSAFLARRIYSRQHPRVTEAIRACADAVAAQFQEDLSRDHFRIASHGRALEYDGIPVADSSITLRLAQHFEACECSGIEVSRNVSTEALAELLEYLLSEKAVPAEGLRIGGITLLPILESGQGDREAGPQEAVSFPISEFDAPMRIYRAAADVMDQTMDSVRQDRDLPLGEIEDVTLWAAEETFASGPTIIAPTQILQQYAHTRQHSLNVFLITTALLQPFARDPKELARFGQAAYLHDIGKSYLPREILDKKGPLTEQEFSIVRYHPEYGVEILASAEKVDSLSLEVAYCHHMRGEGLGYPGPFPEIQPGPVTKVIQVVDMFEALTGRRPYKEPFSVAGAVRTILETPGMEGRRAALGLLVRRLTKAPPGSKVIVASGAQAIVLRVHEEQPMRPTVRFLTDDKGHDLDEPRDVDLRDEDPESPEGRIEKVILKPAFAEL